MGSKPTTGNDRAFWSRSTIRDMVLLVVVVEFAAWLIDRSGSTGAVLRHWPLIALTAFFLYGLVWSIGRIYRVKSDRQTLSIVVLIGSLLGLLTGPILYMIFEVRGDW